MIQQPEISITSDFTATDNKAKLWSALQNNGAFNGISNNFFQKVREEFETNIVLTEQKHKSKSRMDKNRIFLDLMIKKMSEYKEINYSQPYTADDIRNNRMKVFDNELSQKQAEFNQFIQKPNPTEIDFSDKDDQAGGSVDDLLEKAIRERETLNNGNGNHNTPIPSSTTSLESIINDNNSIVTVDMINKIMEKLDSIEKLIRSKKDP